MPSHSSSSIKTLRIATVCWFLMVAISQLLFVLYILKFYGLNAIRNNNAVWSEMTIKGYVLGDTLGNLMFGLHLVFAVILTLCGLIQLVPWIRKKALRLHKYSGRIYITTAVLLSSGGLYLVWVRGAILNLNGGIAISLNALLIIAFAILTITAARSGKLEAHRKWALRTFIVVSGVWFFRIGFMAWIVIHQDAKWSTENLDGPFDLFWAFANYLLPLAILELYFFLKAREQTSSDYVLAIILFLSTILIGVGTFGSYLMMWGPNM